MPQEYKNPQSTPHTAQYSSENPLYVQKNLHAASGIDDDKFKEYDTKMYRSRKLKNVSRGLAMGALGTYVASRPSALANTVSLYATGKTLTPQMRKQLSRTSKVLRYGSLATAIGSVAHRLSAMDLDPVYKGKSAPYKALHTVINPDTDLERYYNDYARPVEPMAKQLNMSKAASITDPQVLATSAAIVGVPWYLRRKLWRAAAEKGGVAGKAVPWLRLANKFL